MFYIQPVLPVLHLYVKLDTNLSHDGCCFLVKQLPVSDYQRITPSLYTLPCGSRCCHVRCYSNEAWCQHKLYRSLPTPVCHVLCWR